MATGTKTALVLRHVSYEGLAGFQAPIETAGYAVSFVDAVSAPFGEAMLAADLLLTMGGPMGAHERAAHPWIADEVAMLAARIAAGKPTLGICLGAQMIAAALGARVYAGPTRIVGFAPIMLEPHAMATPLRHLDGVPLLHWHGDTFDLPGDVWLLARTELYPEVFARGDHLLAIQCHPEMGGTPGLEDWLEGSDGYLRTAGTSAPRLREEYRAHGLAAMTAGRAMLAEWLAALHQAKSA